MTTRRVDEASPADELRQLAGVLERWDSRGLDQLVRNQDEFVDTSASGWIDRYASMLEGGVAAAQTPTVQQLLVATLPASMAEASALVYVGMLDEWFNETAIDDPAQLPRVLRRLERAIDEREPTSQFGTLRATEFELLPEIAYGMADLLSDGTDNSPSAVAIDMINAFRNNTEPRYDTFGRVVLAWVALLFPGDTKSVSEIELALLNELDSP